MLATFVDQNQQNWDEIILYLMMAYRSSVHESTGVIPAELVFGRPINLPIDLILGTPTPEINETYASEYSEQLRKKIKAIYNFARNKLQISSKNLFKEYSRKIRYNKYNVGDLVWFYSPKYPLHGRELGRPCTGPFTVVKRLNDVKQIK